MLARTRPRRVQCSKSHVESIDNSSWISRDVSHIKTVILEKTLQRLEHEGREKTIDRVVVELRDPTLTAEREIDR